MNHRGSLTVRQLQVLEAAADLVNGGMDTEEALMCYRVISQYVVNTKLDKDDD
jgi:hypothetical protein